MVSDEVRFFPSSARSGTTAKPPACAAQQTSNNADRQVARSIAVTLVVDAHGDGVLIIARRDDLGGRNRSEYRVIHGEPCPDAGYGVCAGRIAPDGGARRVGIELVVEG